MTENGASCTCYSVELRNDGFKGKIDSWKMIVEGGRLKRKCINLIKAKKMKEKLLQIRNIEVEKNGET